MVLCLSSSRLKYSRSCGVPSGETALIFEGCAHARDGTQLRAASAQLLRLDRSGKVLFQRALLHGATKRPFVVALALSGPAALQSVVGYLNISTALEWFGSRALQETGVQTEGTFVSRDKKLGLKAGNSFYVTYRYQPAARGHEARPVTHASKD